MPMMHGTNARFFYNGYDYSQKCESVEADFERNMAEVNPLGNAWGTDLPGRRVVGLTVAGLYDGAADESAENAWDAFNDGEPHSYAYLPQGDGVGAYGYCGLSSQGTQAVTAGDDVLRLPLAYVGSGASDRVRVLHALGARANTANGATVDDLAATTTGGAAYLIVTNLAADALDVTVEDSANGTDWDELVAFATRLDGETGDEVIEIAGTIRRYVRATWAVDNGTATFFVALGRR